MKDPFADLRQTAARWGVLLDDGQMELLSRYCSDVLAFNRKANLTAADGPEDVALRHLADGLACVPVLRKLCRAPAPEILDVGSGAGFIGLAIKIAWPEARVTLMEPRLKRYGFLSAEAAALGLSGISLLRRRAEDRREGTDRLYDLVVARALAPAETALAGALPWTRPGGRVVLYQSAAPDPGTPGLVAALDAGDGVWEGARPYRLPREQKDRFLAVFSRRPASQAGGVH
ncbi:MAG: 16S rRNA (guanine(527)-N(7))-methyltransferase RsmG [Elusimicrobiota bacterium]|jgi:16S rRNA (guanine527-N7)-methyltransferase